MKECIKIKKHYKDKYTTIDNQLINDMSISFKAKGVFLYFWSKPNDWELKPKAIDDDWVDRQTVIYSALKELEEAGYLYRKRYYINGKIAGMNYNLSDTKQFDNDLFNQESLNQENLNQVSQDEYIYIQNKDNTKIKNIQNKDNIKEKNIKKEKPTLEEITKYIQEEKLNLNPQSIFNYYEKNNWIKKNGKSVVNWKSTLKTIANTQTIAEKQASLDEILFNVEERKRKYSDYEKIITLHKHRNKLDIVLKDDDIKDFCIKMIKNNTTKATIQDIQNNYEAQDLLKKAYLKYLQQIKTNKQEIEIAIKEELGLFLNKCLDYKYIAVIESLNTFKKESYNKYRIERQEKNLTFLSLKDFILNDIKQKSETINFYNNSIFKEIEKLLD